MVLVAAALMKAKHERALARGFLGCGLGMTTWVLQAPFIDPAIRVR
jgi:hypothetical protein